MSTCFPTEIQFPKYYVILEYMIMDKDHKVIFEVFMAVTLKNAVFWDVMPCNSCVNRRFRGTYHLHLQGRKIHERGSSVSK
jgi:hypothetical protein